MQDIINIDILNAFRLFIHGVDVVHMKPVETMKDATYDAVAFVQANNLQQFVGCEEYNVAVNEFVAEIVGGQHTFDVGMFF